MKNNFENMQDMQRMQQEAVRRVKEMQKRAKQSLVAASTRYSDSNEVDNFENRTQKKPDIIEQTENLNLIQNVDKENKDTNSKQALSKNSNNFNFFSALLKDREKTLILLLILLLIDEGCDMSLVVALMYLII